MHIYLLFLFFSIFDCKLEKSVLTLGRSKSRAEDDITAPKVVVVAFRTKYDAYENPEYQIFLSRGLEKKGIVKDLQFPRGHIKDYEIEAYSHLAAGGGHVEEPQITQEELLNQASEISRKQLFETLSPAATEALFEEHQLSTVGDFKNDPNYKAMSMAASRELFEESGHIGILIHTTPWKTKEMKENPRDMYVFIAHVPYNQRACNTNESKDRDGKWVSVSEVAQKLGETRTDMIGIWQRMGLLFE